MKIFLRFFLLGISSQVFAGDVGSSVVNFVYQRDLPDTEFEFSSNISHGCGSSLYRVSSFTPIVANRKFSVVLTAFTAGKNLAFHDTGVCEGDRSIVSWVRVTN
ncbi:MAG: Spc97/Spc98 family protein [Gammaproteobacteria bacterium]|nr:Spc97/Spc98 family protein [Gammaproteobacteria bacterium]